MFRAKLNAREFQTDPLPDIAAARLKNALINTGGVNLVLTHNYALNWDLFFDSSVGNDSGCRL
jgi:hypothetical protein